MECDLKQRLKDGKVLAGAWVTIGHPDVPDVLETLGFDWLVFDMEHAPIGVEALSSMIQAIDPRKVCPIVRVGAAEQYHVKSALDMGAHGVVFPLVNSAAGAADAVRLSKYPPEGTRGVAPRKASNYGQSFKEYLEGANQGTLVVLQVETKEAVSRIDEIVSVKGVDVAFVEPTDLTVSLGLGADRDHPSVLAAMKSVVSSCDRAGRVAGVLAATPEEAERAVGMGFRFVGLGSDTRFMIAGAKTFLEAARAGAEDA
ncbi:MAG: 4-hydroxy-2-oxo-heptane-1,7-dioate aldolase [Thaumarchaeota archaeon]|nr:4-hydroxy-2-oxo-heptane-1,7-dioate aldolase [Nitrososphaerota archaeon]